MMLDQTLVRLKELKKTKPLRYLLLLLGILCITITLHGQSKNILFYNVENLFDTFDDSIKLDNEFLPKGERYWNYTKYNQKLKNIAQVIYEADSFNMPIIIGLCEVENIKTLNDLIFKTGLNNVNYFPIHFESPDNRGIDVALLYKADEFKVDSSRVIPVNLNSGSRPTRDILHVFGHFKDSLNLHVFVNHWPSRYGGVMETHQKRIDAAKILASSVNEITNIDATANIVVMGDFNDNPNEESLTTLVALSDLKNITHSKKYGSIKHKHEWHLFDQFLISKSLIDYSNFKIIDFDYLFEKDETHLGVKPNRTYVGYKYNGGYSDHLPVMLSLDLGQ